MKLLQLPARLLPTLAAAFLLLGALTAAANTGVPPLRSELATYERADAPLNAVTKEYLTARDGDRALVWVFLTDKLTSPDDDFATLAATTALSERALKRRAKVGLDRVVFADLPVSPTYLAEIEKLGGQLRRTSRWLNGASFEAPTERLAEIAALPFVREIKPVMKFRKRPIVADELDESARPQPTPGSKSLNYGASLGQLEQINVPELHEQGLHGEGVTLAILDAGFRTTHEAFSAHFAEGRVLAKYDFIFNDTIVDNQIPDAGSQWNHGTYIWSTSGGESDAHVYGPAYKANFILCKTEDVRSETQIEEDNWVAALEWVDSIGADVATSSLGYYDWDDGSGYTYADMDGATATTSIAASLAASMGIVLCNSAGNEGSDPGTIIAPADAHDMLTCGAVDSDGDIAYFSSRGPTVDGRIKPEVCAQGVTTICATANSDVSYGSANGTSLSTPLVAGVACLVIQANPTFTPLMVRDALMKTGSRAIAPDNNYGWGIIDASRALGYGVDFSSNHVNGPAPISAQFTGTSGVLPDSWSWDFGDGASSDQQSPSHYYRNAGIYNVSLTVSSTSGDFTRTKPAYVVALGDTVTFVSDSVMPGQSASVAVNAHNTLPLDELIVSFKIGTAVGITFDSTSLGARTSYFEHFAPIMFNPSGNKYTYRLRADDGGGSPPLPAGEGEILKLHFSVAADADGGESVALDSLTSPYAMLFTSPYMAYEPVSVAGTFSVISLLRGDLDGSQTIDVADLVYLVDYMFNAGPEPTIWENGNVNGVGSIDIADLVYLVDYMFNGGPPPPM